MAQHRGGHTGRHKAAELVKECLIVQLCQVEKKAGCLRGTPSNSASLVTKVPGNDAGSLREGSHV